jgi:hypothetical protein
MDQRRPDEGSGQRARNEVVKVSGQKQKTTENKESRVNQ